MKEAIQITDLIKELLTVTEENGNLDVCINGRFVYTKDLPNTIRIDSDSGVIELTNVVDIEDLDNRIEKALKS